MLQKIMLSDTTSTIQTPSILGEKAEVNNRNRKLRPTFPKCHFSDPASRGQEFEDLPATCGHLVEDKTVANVVKR